MFCIESLYICSQFLEYDFSVFVICSFKDAFKSRIKNILKMYILLFIVYFLYNYRHGWTAVYEYRIKPLGVVLLSTSLHKLQNYFVLIYSWCFVQKGVFQPSWIPIRYRRGQRQLLFLIYINDLLESAPELSYTCFANDTNIFSADVQIMKLSSKI